MVLVGFQSGRTCRGCGWLSALSPLCTWLVVREGDEGLGLLSTDGGVPLDEAGHHTSSRLNTKRERGATS